MIIKYVSSPLTPAFLIYEHIFYKKNSQILIGSRSMFRAPHPRINRKTYLPYFFKLKKSVRGFQWSEDKISKKSKFIIYTAHWKLGRLSKVQLLFMNFTKCLSRNWHLKSSPFDTIDFKYGIKKLIYYFWWLYEIKI